MQFAIPETVVRLKGKPVDRSKWGPEADYDERIRKSLVDVPFRAINWGALPLADMREILRILGKPVDSSVGEYNLERTCRQAVFEHQRSAGWAYIPPREDAPAPVVTTISGIPVAAKAAKPVKRPKKRRSAQEIARQKRLTAQRSR